MYLRVSIIIISLCDEKENQIFPNGTVMPVGCGLRNLEKQLNNEEQQIAREERRVLKTQSRENQSQEQR